MQKTQVSGEILLTLYLPVSSADNLGKQFGPSDGIPERFFSKS